MEPIVLRPGEGEKLALGEGNLVYKAESADTGGAFGLTEYTLGATATGPPRHVHDRLYDAFYVLEGELEFTLGDESVAAPAGTFVLVPPGVPHTFRPRGGDARFLNLHAPGGFEAYFRELAALLRPGEPPDPEALAAVSSRYDFRPV